MILSVWKKGSVLAFFQVLKQARAMTCPRKWKDLFLAGQQVEFERSFGTGQALDAASDSLKVLVTEQPFEVGQKVTMACTDTGVAGLVNGTKYYIKSASTRSGTNTQDLTLSLTSITAEEARLGTGAVVNISADFPPDLTLVIDAPFDPGGAPSVGVTTDADDFFNLSTEYEMSKTIGLRYKTPRHIRKIHAIKVVAWFVHNSSYNSREEGEMSFLRCREIDGDVLTNVEPAFPEMGGVPLLVLSDPRRVADMTQNHYVFPQPLIVPSMTFELYARRHSVDTNTKLHHYYPHAGQVQLHLQILVEES